MADDNKHEDEQSEAAEDNESVEETEAQGTGAAGSDAEESETGSDAEDSETDSDAEDSETDSDASAAEVESGEDSAVGESEAEAASGEDSDPDEQDSNDESESEAGASEDPQEEAAATTDEPDETDAAPENGEEPASEAFLAPALYLAEFETPGEILHAAEKVRDEGFARWDVHTPFPVHGMDKAMGLGDSQLGWISFFMGATGLIGAYFMMYWMNGVDYPIIIGGKPPEAIPSMVPILFECTVLLTGIGTVFGMLGLNKLPRHHHPVFYSERFARASDDKFFISIEAADPKFDLEKTKRFLESLSPSYLELVEEEVA
ncbi:MAG: quinol:electron acceptor oxidoreductase subunit ActD [Myxococcota bacterium]